jgi:lipopolysaccharide/colanic/teichoic acid biosynthesis glycosyltransferase
LWQVTARRDPSFERNVELDIEYIKNWNLWLDVRSFAKRCPPYSKGVGCEFGAGCTVSPA